MRLSLRTVEQLGNLMQKKSCIFEISISEDSVWEYRSEGTIEAKSSKSINLAQNVDFLGMLREHHCY
jgi:hypothetical protein